MVGLACAGRDPHSLAREQGIAKAGDAEQEELKRLRCENRQLREEQEILS